MAPAPVTVEVREEAAPAPQKSGPPAWALAAGGLAGAVALSAGVAALVASAIVSGRLDEALASTPSGGLTARRMEAMPGVAEPLCLDAVEGEMCHRLVRWAMEDGARFNPEAYTGVNSSSPFNEVQAMVHAQHPDLCPQPCGAKAAEGPVAAAGGPTAESAHESIGCDFDHGDSKPAHAGCFITRGGKLLAERLTYDGSKYDIPGGQTNWREPARCTAYRETYEETGYLARPRELLAVVRNGFHIYRCELIRGEPVKGHDHEISWVGWMDAGEIGNRLSQRAWRFPEANRYASWLR